MVGPVDRGLQARQIRRFEKHLRERLDDLAAEILADAGLLISDSGDDEEDEPKSPSPWENKAGALSASIRNLPQWVAEVETQETAGEASTAKGNDNDKTAHGPPESIATSMQPPDPETAHDAPESVTSISSSPQSQSARSSTSGTPTTAFMQHTDLETAHDTPKSVTSIASSPQNQPAQPAASATLTTRASMQPPDREALASKVDAVVQQQPQAGKYPLGYLKFLALKNEAKRRGQAK